MAAPVCLEPVPAERTGAEADMAGWRLEAVARLDRQRAAEGIQAEERVRTGNQVDAGDRERWQRVPIDRVAERLVDAHAVLIHGKSLRGTEQRRRRKASKHEIRL